jgi:hypothetical protein
MDTEGRAATKAARAAVFIQMLSDCGEGADSSPAQLADGASYLLADSGAVGAEVRMGIPALVVEAVVDTAAEDQELQQGIIPSKEAAAAAGRSTAGCTLVRRPVWDWDPVKSGSTWSALSDSIAPPAAWSRAHATTIPSPSKKTVPVNMHRAAGAWTPRHAISIP